MSRRRSASMAALSADSSTPSAFATCPHRIDRRLDFRETGHFEQASTSRSSFAGRWRAAHLWQAVRSVKTRVCIVNTRPIRNHAWKWRVSPSGSCMSIIVVVFNNCCNASLRSAPSAPAYAQASPKAPMASQASPEAYKRRRISMTSTEKHHLQLAKRLLDRGESSVVTGSGVFSKSEKWIRIYSEKHDKEVVQVGNYWLAKNRTATNPSVTVT